MYITVELSYYPLTSGYEEAVDLFISLLEKDRKVTSETGPMSTLLSGEYADVMNLLAEAMGRVMEDYPSVFNLKIANACRIQDRP